jgi:hypothetical protein
VHLVIARKLKAGLGDFDLEKMKKTAPIFKNPVTI